MQDNTPLNLIAQPVMALLQLAEFGRQTGNDLYSVSLDWDTTKHRWQLTAMTAFADDQAAAIDAVRTWAHALGGTVHLGDVEHIQLGNGTVATRTLDCRAELAGVSVTVHERLYDIGSQAAAVPATA